MEEKHNYINSVINAIQVIELFTDNSSLGVTEVSQALGIHKATAFKLLQTLKSEGWLFQDPKSKCYSFGISLLPLAQAVVRSFSAENVIRQLLGELGEYFQEDIVLCKLVGKEALCVMKIESNHIMVTSAKEGCTLPVHLGATGKVLLAYQDEKTIQEIYDQFSEEIVISRAAYIQDLQTVREQGYAITCSNYDKGIHAVGVPVFNKKGFPQFSLSIVGPVERMRLLGLVNIKDKLIDVAKKISEIYDLP
jgi:IclR family KDG regulon transcriptional repressor